MSPETRLLRQVHPSFVQSGQITSQVFEPTAKDELKLSVYDGDMIEPADSYEHYTNEYESAGVVGVTVAECTSLELEVASDPEPFPEHVLVDFSAFGTSAIKKKAKKLKAKAVDRNWLYQP